MKLHPALLLATVLGLSLAWIWVRQITALLPVDTTQSVAASVARRAPMRLDPETLAAYAGEYRLDAERTVTVSAAADRLIADLPGEGPQGRLELFAESESEFFARESSVEVRFLRNLRGEVTGLVATSGLQRFELQRIR